MAENFIHLKARGWADSELVVRIRGGKRELRGKPVRGATTSPTWLSQLDTPSLDTSGKPCFVCVRQRSCSPFRASRKVTWVEPDNGDETISREYSRTRARNNFLWKIFLSIGSSIIRHTAGLRARCMAYVYVCVSRVSLYIIASVFRDACLLHRRSIKRWRRVEYFDIVCVYSRLLRTSHLRIFAVCVLQHVCAFISFATSTPCSHAHIHTQTHFIPFRKRSSGMSVSPMIFHEMSRRGW